MKVELHQVQQEVEMAASGEESPKLISAGSPADAPFTFDSKIDELATKLRRTLEVEEESLLKRKELELISGRKGKMEPTHSHPPISSTRSLSLAHEEMEVTERTHPPSPCPGKKRDWKIPRFLRRTQSATEDEEGQSGLMAGRGHATMGAGSGSVFLPSSKSKEGERCRSTSGSKMTPDPLPHLSSKDEVRPRSSSEIDKESGSNKWRVRGGTEMKFGLGFLKRRHTEGQISPPSVRPSPEEAKKWSESFQNLMISKYGQCLFKAFLRREFSHENIEFWIAVEQYRKARERKLPAKAQKIINEFVLSQAPREVNLDSVTKDVLINTTSFSQPDYNTFDQAQKKIQGILEADAYIRFLQSDLYLELLYPERYSSTTSPSESPQTEKPNASKSFGGTGNKDGRKGLSTHADSTE